MASFPRKYFEILIWSDCRPRTSHILHRNIPCPEGSKSGRSERIGFKIGDGREAPDLIPDRQKKPAVVGSVHTAPGMVGVVLEAGVDDPVMRRDEAVLVTAVKVNTVAVEKQAVSKYVALF